MIVVCPQGDSCRAAAPAALASIALALQISDLPIRIVADTERPSDTRWSLHFSAADVVEYLTKALELPPRQGELGTRIFENSNAPLPEDRFRIIVAQEERDVVVSFAVSGESGMSIIREFLESPLFTRKESEQLHKAVEEADGAPTLKFERFSVGARAWKTQDQFHIVLRFFRPDGRVRLERG